MILSIIQARMASSRLPGKVLLDIAGVPMLQRVVERARLAETVDEVVVATTIDPSDELVAEFCSALGYPFTRGSVHDVLDRYVQTARRFKADRVVRLTADCPLLDPGLVDATVNLLINRTEDGGRSPVFRPPSPVLDFAANRLPPPWGRTYPIGLDVEVATLAALERAWEETAEKHHREHVMPYCYDDLPAEPLEAGRVYTTPRGFRVAQLHHTTDHGAIRWTVDTPEDLAAVRALTERLPPDFTWLDALRIWERHPEIARTNAGVRHKTALDIDERS
ncbi:MAG TPA: glycosyltransferase family protein [Anaerolineales bacterium]|nr:glycosyltransferase family protein [Anaerolineales bacterium]